MILIRRVLWSLLLLGLLSTSLMICSRVAERGRYVGAYSSYGAGPKGTRGLYLLSERLGAAPTRWAQDLAALPPPPAMLVALGGCDTGMARKLSRYERQELERWVEGGGTLLVAGARHYLPETLGVGFERDPRCREGFRFIEMEDEEDASATGDEDLDEVLEEAGLDAEADPESIWAVPEGKLLAGIEWVPLVEPGRIRVDDDKDFETVLSVDDAPDMPQSTVRREAAVVVPHGKGRMVVLASASPLQNRTLASAEGGVIFSRIVSAYAPSGPVLFDEYHLGVGERRSMMQYFRSAGMGPVALQLLLVVGLLLLRTGTRFGGIREELPEPPGGTASFVASMGNLFSRAGDPRGAVEILVRQALGRVAHHHHMPGATAERLQRVLSARGLRSAAEAVHEIGGVEREAIGLKPAQLPEISHRLDELVEQAMRTDDLSGATPGQSG